MIDNAFARLKVQTEDNCRPIPKFCLMKLIFEMIPHIKIQWSEFDYDIKLTKEIGKYLSLKVNIFIYNYQYLFI